MSNDSIRTALDTLGAAIAIDPAKARAKGTSATARVVDGLQCEILGPYGERLVTDMPRAMGGAASGPNPGWLMRSALASCTATVIAMRAAQLGVTLASLEVVVDSDSDTRGMLGLDERVSAGMQALRTVVRIGAPGVAPEVLRELVEWSDAHSPVGCTVRRAPECSLRIDVV